eukprot:775840_1
MAPPKWLGPVLIAAVIAGVGLFAFSVFWTQNEEIGQAKPTPAEPVDAEHVQADLDQADQAGPDQANQVDPNQAKPVDPLVRDALTRPLRMRLPVQAESGQESGPEMAAQNEPNQIMLTQAGQGVPDQAVSSSDHVEAGQKTSDEVKLDFRGVNDLDVKANHIQSGIEKWYAAEILGSDAEGIMVHYRGFAAEFEEEILKTSDRLAPRGTHVDWDAPVAHKILTILGQEICKVTESGATLLQGHIRCPDQRRVLLDHCDFQPDP